MRRPRTRPRPARPSLQHCSTARCAQMAQVFDPVNGGFGRQPKFPHPGAMTLLLHRWYDHPVPSPRAASSTAPCTAWRGVASTTSSAAGSTATASTPSGSCPTSRRCRTTTPSCSRPTLDAYALFGTEEYAAAARGIVRWVREVMSDPAGGYAASQDADVGLDDDGDYFTWTRDEAAAALSPEEMEVAAAYYDIGTGGRDAPQSRQERAVRRGDGGLAGRPAGAAPRPRSAPRWSAPGRSFARRGTRARRRSSTAPATPTGTR